MSELSRLHQDPPNALASGTRLGEFELRGPLGVGGFGIVYLAFDHALEREVAIKEYMPASLAGRTETLRVSIRSQADAESFALGLKSFVNEAKLLARFDHPSLLKVLRFWEANGTAYMAMPVLRGRTLKQIRQAMSGPPDEAWLRRLLMPLLGAIEVLHGEGVYHRDIAPDNIQIEPDGRPVLMDFGAARRVLGDRSQMLTAILKPAYAPIEQYGEAGAVKQGPWTDLYALGATLHYLLLGRPPPPATARAVHDEASALTAGPLPGCSEAFLQAIDWMLSPRPTDRPQSVAELREVLEGRAGLPPPRALEPVPVPWERTRVLAPGGAGGAGPGGDAADPAYAPTQIVDTPVPGGDTAGHVWLEPDAAVRGAAPAPMVAPASRPARGGRGALLALGLLVAAGAAAAVMFWPRPASAPQAAAGGASQAGTAAGSSPAPVGVTAAPALAAGPAAVSDTVRPGDAGASAALGMASPIQPAQPPGALPGVVDKPPEPVQNLEVPARAPTTPAPPKPAPPRAAATRTAAEAPPARAEPASLAPMPEPAAIAPAGPAPACGASTGVRYHVCMERECGAAALAAHPACQRWKQEARRE